MTKTMETQLVLHPYCALFPRLNVPDFAELVADIRAHGLHDPITIRGGMILDGQNRYEACLVAGVEPRFEVYDGLDPLGFVISKNLSRRHLDTGQRAMIAAELAKIPHGGDRRSDQSRNSDIENQTDAAKSLKVSRDSVIQARKIADKSPALAAEVKAGNVSLNTASTVAKLPRARITKAVEKGVDVLKRLAAGMALKERTSRAVTIDNLARSGVYCSAPAPAKPQDARTPGQVCRETYEAAQADGVSTEECWEEAAQAVMRI